MPKIQVPKEDILQAALKLMIREGYEQVNIKSVAKELKRSTQTISWSFGNMDNFRTALAEYALAYVNRRMYSDASDPMLEYGNVGTVYIDMAFDEPNLIRFLRSDEKHLKECGGLGGSFDSEAIAARQKTFSEHYGCSEEDAKHFMLTMMIYTQGLVSMITAGGLDIDKKTAHKMLSEMGVSMMRLIASDKGKKK